MFDRSVSTKKEPDINKVAYMTFDDGPKRVTNLILDILAEYKVVGTFFILEPQIRRFPNTTCRIIREGHSVGLHGVTHQVSQFYASEQSVVEEFRKTRETLKRVTGSDTVLVRVPYGTVPHMKPEYIQAVKQAGYRLWDWNVDSLDWKYRDQRFVNLVKRRVIKLEKSGVPPVILMHDRPETACLLPEVINFLVEQGYVMKKLDSSLTPVTLK